MHVPLAIALTQGDSHALVDRRGEFVGVCILQRGEIGNRPFELRDARHDVAVHRHGVAQARARHRSRPVACAESLLAVHERLLQQRYGGSVIFKQHIDVARAVECYHRIRMRVAQRRAVDAQGLASRIARAGQIAARTQPIISELRFGRRAGRAG